MPMLVAGLLLLWMSSILLRGFVRANPAAVARQVRKGGGWIALVFALFMMLRGEFNVAFGAACFGFWMLGTSFNPFSAASWQRGAPRWGNPRGASRVASPTVEVMLQRGTGRIVGRCLAGPYAGKMLDELSQGDCLSLHGWCGRVDPQGARLLETYFDRRFTGWREATERGDDGGSAEPGFRGTRAARMPEREAYQVLGLQQGASREDVTRAHRRLMKQYHPDHGGSTEMAARVNEAKDVLMRRHP